jgi:hypothetical protein
MDVSPLIADARSAGLRAAVARAYETFAHHPEPTFPLGVCLACCVAPDVERELREWTLGRLTAGHFHDYNTSAKPPVQAVPELGHFLPRMLELLADGQEIHHSIELALCRLGNCPAQAWSEAERRALDQFAAAYFDRCLRSDPECSGPCDRFLDDPFSVALMFEIGGIAIEPLLDLWLRCEDPLSTVLYVESTWRHFWDTETWDSSFASDRPEFQRKIRAWVLDAECRRAFAAKLLTPEFQRLAEARPQSDWVPFATMVEAVFDRLTE